MDIPQGMNLRVTGDRRPIGYWLKHLDRLIEDTFDRTLAGAGVTRRHWQTLNTLARESASREKLDSALDPFVRADPGGLATVLDDLVRRGWVQIIDDGRLSLTPAGAAAHQTVQEEVDRTRQLVLTNVTADEYAQTIDVLQRMAATLEAAAIRATRGMACSH